VRKVKAGGYRCIDGDRKLKVSILTPEEKELLIKAVSLMDEIAETLEVMHDDELVQDLRDALKEVEEGKTRPLDDLIEELGLESEV